MSSAITCSLMPRILGVKTERTGSYGHTLALVIFHIAAPTKSALSALRTVNLGCLPRMSYLVSWKPRSGSLSDPQLSPSPFATSWVSSRRQHQRNTSSKSSMGQSSSLDYKELFERETKLRRQAQEERRQAEARNRQFTRKTSLLEYLRTCHNLLSRPLRVRAPSRYMKGKIPAPQGKYCPARLLPWIDCADAQQDIYDSVCGYLQATCDHPPQLFSTVSRLEGPADS